MTDALTNLPLPHLIFLIGTLIYVSIRLYFQKRCLADRKSILKDSLPDWILVLLVAAGQVFVPLMLCFSRLLNSASYELPFEATYVGAPLLLFGLWLFWKSHADLGRSWSVSLKLNQNHQLITHGVYRLVRHPMYASFFVLAISQAMLLKNWLAGPAALVAVSLLYVIRRPQEEKMMLDHFGSEYGEYRRRTGGILPRRKMERYDQRDTTRASTPTTFAESRRLP